MSSRDIIAHIKEYEKELKEHQNVALFDADKYLSLLDKLEAVKASNEEVQNKQKQLEVLQKEFDELNKQNQIHQDDYDKKIKNIQQQKTTYINGNLQNNTDLDKIIDVLKSGVLEYQYAVKLIKNNNAIKQQIRDGKYVIARKGNHVALISVGQDVLGYKKELTNFLQQDDNNISNVILSNVPIYNNGSHVLSFDKDAQDLPDDVLKIYFSTENDSKLDFVVDARKTDVYNGIVEEVVKQLMAYQQKKAGDAKINVQIEGSSYGIIPLLTGFLLAKYSDMQQCLSLSNCRVNLSLIPRSMLNGITPEMMAKKVDELFRLAIVGGYDAKNTDRSFVNLDILSNDNFGRFEYHDVGSTDSFLKALNQLQVEYNSLHTDGDKQTLLVAVNEAMRPIIKKNNGVINKSIGFLTGSVKQELFNTIGKDVYDGIKVRTMNDIADAIESKNTTYNKIASINKEKKDGISHNANVDKNANNSTISATVANNKVNKSI